MIHAVRLSLIVALALTLAIVLAAVLVSGASGRETARPARTLAAVKGRLLGFDQDGSRLATLERPQPAASVSFVVRRSSGHLLTRFRVLHVWNATRFVFGGTRGLWLYKDYDSAGNEYYKIHTVALDDRRHREVGWMRYDPYERHGGTLGGLAAAGAVALFSELRWWNYPPDCEPESGKCGTELTGGQVYRVSRETSALPTLGPGHASLVAVGGGRIAMAILSKGATTTSTRAVEIVTPVGERVSSFVLDRSPAELALSSDILASLSRSKRSAHLELHAPSSGNKLGDALLPRGSKTLSVAGSSVVFRTGRRIWELDARTRKRRLAATAAADPIGLSIEGNRIAWAENLRGTARIRAVFLRP